MDQALASHTAGLVSIPLGHTMIVRKVPDTIDLHDLAIPINFEKHQRT